MSISIEDIGLPPEDYVAPELEREDIYRLEQAALAYQYFGAGLGMKVLPGGASKAFRTGQEMARNASVNKKTAQESLAVLEYVEGAPIECPKCKQTFALSQAKVQAIN